MIRKYYAVALLSWLLTGCITPAAIPETVVDVAKKHSSFTENDIIEVNQPFAHVSEILKNKSKECFRKQVSSEVFAGSSGGRQHFLTQVTVVTPNVTVSSQKTRLTLQTKIISGSTELGGTAPPDGWYYMVVDAYPEGRQKTRVEMYYQKTASSYYVAYPAVKSWVTGKNMSCPDFANEKSAN